MIKVYNPFNITVFLAAVVLSVFLIASSSISISESTEEEKGKSNYSFQVFSVVIATLLLAFCIVFGVYAGIKGTFFYDVLKSYVTSPET